MNRKTRATGSLEAALIGPQRSRRPAQSRCGSDQNQQELTIGFNKLHKTAIL
jgi:hypothetical protein